MGWGGVLTYMTRCCYLPLHVATYVMLRCLGWGGVGWGINVHDTLLLSSLARCHIGQKDSRGKTTLLLADGAPCYKALSKMHKLLLRQCNHSKGIFSVWRSVHGRGSVRVHTGGIDAYWTLLKSAVPNSITSTVGGKPNKSLWMYMRSQQWRWECHDKDLLAFTGQTLAKL